MRRIQHSSYGNPSEVVEIVECEAAKPAEGEVQIAVEASPIRFQDLYTIRGTAGFRRPLPDCPGGIGIGRITEAGRGVANVKPGDRVYLRQVNGAGTYGSSSGRIAPCPRFRGSHPALCSQQQFDYGVRPDEMRCRLGTG